MLHTGEELSFLSGSLELVCGDYCWLLLVLCETVLLLSDASSSALTSSQFHLEGTALLVLSHGPYVVTARQTTGTCLVALGFLLPHVQRYQVPKMSTPKNPTIKSRLGCSRVLFPITALGNSSACPCPLPHPCPTLHPRPSLADPRWLPPRG